MTMSTTAVKDVAEPAAVSLPRPRHIAIIMDGNGRWASQRGLPRFRGHRAGVDALRRVIEAAGDLRIPYLTLFSFSSENWSRPADEVAELMRLLKVFVRRHLAELRQNGVRVRVIGGRDNVPADIGRLIEEAETTTAHNSDLNLTVAFNYGGRDEIVRAARRLAEDVAAGRIDPAALTNDRFDGYLDTGGLPDPDLLIRTSGEERLSNFMLWQCAYTEFVFTPVYWPDFGRADLEAAISAYGSRNRRFGGVDTRAAS